MTKDEAPAAPVQEPVGVVGWAANRPNTVPVVHWADECPEIGTKIYTAAPVQEPDHGDELTIAYMSGLHDGKQKRAWVGLTDEELELLNDCGDTDSYKFARAIEAKLKEKNGWYRQHVTDGSPCWCEPEISYTNPETGASVIVHKEPQ